MRIRVLLLIAALFAVLLPAPSVRAAGVDFVEISGDRYNGLWSVMNESADGHPMLASYGNGKITVRTCQNADCTRVPGGTIAQASSANFDFAIGPDGLPVFVVASSPSNWGGAEVDVVKCSDIHCRKYKTTNQIWSTRTSRTQASVSIDVDRDNHPTVVLATSTWSWGIPGGLISTPGDKLLLSCDDPACRSTEQQTLRRSRGSAIATGANGFPILALGSEGASGSMTLERCLDAGCVNREITDFGASGSTVSDMAVLGDEITIVSTDGSQRARRDVCIPAKCFGDEILSEPGVRARQPKVAYGESGRTVVSYNSDYPGDLWMHRCAALCEGESLLRRRDWNDISSTGVTVIGQVGYISFQAPGSTRLVMARFAV